MAGTPIPEVPSDVFADAVRRFWLGRDAQIERQRLRGTIDQGSRGAVTGGSQLDGFLDTIGGLLVAAGLPEASVVRRETQLPGYFRASKAWDLLVVHSGELLAAIECKSQVGSFGNNFNNRTEEALGSSLDLWTAFREGAFGHGRRPWIGYLFVLEDAHRSRQPVGVREPHFPVFDEFRDASYLQRLTIMARRLILERHYDAACVVLTDRTAVDLDPNYSEPAEDLAGRRFLLQLLGHVVAAIAD